MLVTDWAAAFAPHGLVPVEEIGSGMEGTVVRLEGDRVAKVWHSAAPEDLAVRQAFYADVATALPLATTRILDVVRVGDRWASIEPLLHGTPLAGPLTDSGADAVADVLAALGSLDADTRDDRTGALPGEPPLDVSAGFEEGLARLVEHRANDVLAAAVPGLCVPAIADAVPPPARRADAGARRRIPANVLLDDRGRPSAVIDFGFLTTVGDPAFDAAVTASIFDMYGDAARSTEARLDVRLDIDPRRGAVHRAAMPS